MKHVFKVIRWALTVCFLTYATLFPSVTVSLLDLDTDPKNPTEIASYEIDIENEKYDGMELWDLKGKIKEWNPDLTISGQVFFADDKAATILSDSTSISNMKKVYVACPLFAYQVNVLLPNNKVIAIPVFPKDLISTLLERVKQAVTYDYPRIGMNAEEVKSLSLDVKRRWDNDRDDLDPATSAGDPKNEIFNYGMYYGCSFLRLNHAVQQNTKERIPTSTTNLYPDEQAHSLWKKMNELASKKEDKDLFLEYANARMLAQVLQEHRTYLPLSHREFVEVMLKKISQKLEVITKVVKADPAQMEAMRAIDAPHSWFFAKAQIVRNFEPKIWTSPESIANAIKLLEMVEGSLFHGKQLQFASAAKFDDIFKTIQRQKVLDEDPAVRNSEIQSVKEKAAQQLEELAKMYKALRARGAIMPELVFVAQPGAPLNNTPPAGLGNVDQPPAPQPQKIIDPNNPNVADPVPLLNHPDEGQGIRGGGSELYVAAVGGAVVGAALLVYLVHKYRQHRSHRPKASMPNPQQEPALADLANQYESLTDISLEDARHALAAIKLQWNKGLMTEAEYKAARWNILRRYAPEKHAFIESEAELA